MKLIIGVVLVTITAVFLAKHFPIFKTKYKDVTYHIASTTINIAIDEDYFNKSSFNDVFSFVLEKDEELLKSVLEDKKSPLPYVLRQYAEEKANILAIRYKELFRLKANGTISKFEIISPFGRRIAG